MTEEQRRQIIERIESQANICRVPACICSNQKADVATVIRAIEAIGYRIVPEQPTNEMVMAGCSNFLNQEPGFNAGEQPMDMVALYRCMIAASPKLSGGL